jgi:hypothetical protein
MKVQATTNLGYNDYPAEFCLTDGQEADVPDHVGAAMVKRGHAIDVTPPEVKKPIRAKVEAEPANETQKTTK